MPPKLTVPDKVNDSVNQLLKQVIELSETKSLLVVDLMKVITSYAIEQVPPVLTVPDEINDSANQLLKQVIELSETT